MTDRFSGKRFGILAYYGERQPFERTIPVIRRPCCPICSDDSVSSVGMFLAPWFMAIAEISPSEGLVTMHWCSSCELWWSGRGITEREVSCVYSGYRGERYFRIRKRFEPWYLKRHNQDRSVNDAVQYRRELTPPDIENWFASRTKLEVLDFGGDTGSMIPEWAGEQKVYVVDESAKNRQSGVETISLSEATSLRFDVVAAMHVVEHLDDPVGQLSILVDRLEPDGLMYVEVPLDGQDLPFRQPLVDNSFAQRFLWWVLRSSLSSVLWRVAWIIFDLGVVALQYLSPIRIRRLKISEHINYFSEQALCRLGARVGLERVETVHLGGNRAAQSGVESQSVGMWFCKREL